MTPCPAKTPFLPGRGGVFYHQKDVYDVFFITDEKGTVIGDTAGAAMTGKDLSREAYFKKAMKGETSTKRFDFVPCNTRFVGPP